MLENLFKKGKDVAKKITMATAITGAVMTSPEAKGLENTNTEGGKNLTEKVSTKDNQTKSDTFTMFKDADVEKEFSPEEKTILAKEALENIEKGTPFISKLKPGCIAIPNEISYINNSGKDQYGVRVNIYKVSKSMEGYIACSVVVEAKGTPDELLSKINNKELTVGAGIKVKEEKIPTNPLSISYLYLMLREKSSPDQIQALLEGTGKDNFELVVKSLESVINGSNKDYDAQARTMFAEDLEKFKAKELAEK